MPFEHAVGWSFWPCLLNELDLAFVSECNEAFGMPSRNTLPTARLNLLVFFASQTDPSWAGSLNLMCGHWPLPMLLFPEFAIKLTVPQSEHAHWSPHGANDRFLFVVGQRLDPGSWWPLACPLTMTGSLVGLIVTGQFDNVPNPKEPTFFWVLLMLAIANSLLRSS